MRQAGAAWGEEEVRRLVIRYAEAEGSSKTAKVENILEEFPGRTVKSVQTKLREAYPEVYYQRAGIPEQWNVSHQRQQQQQQETPDPSSRTPVEGQPTSTDESASGKTKTNS